MVNNYMKTFNFAGSYINKNQSDKNFQPSYW